MSPRSVSLAVAAIATLAVSATSAQAADTRYGIYTTSNSQRGSVLWNGDSIDINSGKASMSFFGKGKSWARYGGRAGGTAIAFRAIYVARFACFETGASQATKVFVPQKIVSLGRAGSYARRNLPHVEVLGPVGSDCPGTSTLLDTETDGIVKIQKRVNGRWVLVAKTFSTP